MFTFYSFDSVLRKVSPLFVVNSPGSGISHRRQRQTSPILNGVIVVVQALVSTVDVAHPAGGVVQCNPLALWKIQ